MFVPTIVSINSESKLKAVCIRMNGGKEMFNLKMKSSGKVILLNEETRVVETEHMDKGIAHSFLSFNVDVLSEPFVFDHLPIMAYLDNAKNVCHSV